MTPTRARSSGSGNVLAVATEVWTARPDLLKENDAARTLLENAGYRLAATFGVEWWGHNEVYVRTLPRYSASAGF